MNLEESDKFVEEQRQTEQKKKIVLASIILCAILVALLLIMIIYIQYQDSLKLKMYIDGTQVEFGSNMFYSENNVTYFNLKSMADLMGYTYTKGEYKKYNENIDSCYIKNDLEVVAFTADEKSFTKYIDVNTESPLLQPEGPYGIEMQILSNNGDSNTFTLENPAKLIENDIYVPFDKIRDIFNVGVNTNTENRIRLYTLPVLFKDALQTAAKLEYSTVSGAYENIRALPYGLIVVGNNGEYGVIDNAGSIILSVKYENLQFIQNVNEFFMRAENTVGLLDSKGNTIIAPMEYDDMSVLDEVEQLYLVKKDGKYGVLNRKGEIVVHVDYDRIGLNKIEDYDIEDMRNPYLLHDSAIVVEMDGKYGLFSIEGKELLKTVYEDMGYKTTSTDVAGEKSVLLLPKSTGIKGVVVKFNGMYGIYDINAESLIIPCTCTRIYSITKAGTTTYYMEFGAEQIELDGYLTYYELKTEGVPKKNKVDDNTNTVVNDTDNNTVDSESTSDSEEVSSDENSSTDENYSSEPTEQDTSDEIIVNDEEGGVEE